MEKWKIDLYSGDTVLVSNAGRFRIYKELNIEDRTRTDKNT